MTCLKWAFFACFVCSSLGLQTLSQSCDPSDLLALKEFAGNLTNGSIITSWSNNNSVCCQWDGVVCGNEGNDDSVASRVTMLILPNKGLKGIISRSLGRLDKLKLLDLSSNHFEGVLPVELVNLKQLEVLDLSHNMLTGRVSQVLSGLKMIRSLNVSSNSFSGDLLELGGFPNLAVFNVSNNSFTGMLNSQIWSASNGTEILDLSMNHFVGSLELEGLANCSSSIKELHLDVNSLSGHLPDSLYSFSSLQQLSLSENYFSGQLSKELSKLTSLKNLIIFENHFSGELPNVFGNLTELEFFIANSNSFSGPLPLSLALCSKLHVLDVRNNSLSGSVDLNFTGLPSLGTLVLSCNHFSGPLPNSLVDCHQLKIVNLARNGFTGQVPESFAKLKSLTFLSLSNNSFVDLYRSLSVLQQCKNLTTLILSMNFIGEEIPNNVSGFESLIVLGLANCGLKGRIPVWLSSSNKLQFLDLSWNHLDGSIPPWIGSMDDLFYLDLSNNSLTGEIPKNLTELKSLILSSNHTYSAGIPTIFKNHLQYKQASSFPPSIVLRNNMINGTIPPEVRRWKQLHVLDLSWNNISGIIPSSISEIGNLEVLDLSSNDLIGSIPASFVELTFLSKFNVAYNHLHGGVPTGGQFDTFPASSFDGNQGLCREIDFPCGSSIVPEPVLLPQLEELESPFAIDWKVVLIGYGTGLIIGLVLGYIFYTRKYEWFKKIYGMRLKRIEIRRVR
ncbi:hypothetical protein Q3G72_013711 [Acer saccharum]|nr:hypothetical protein Q3G72_013711 [Acer saccharum]